jgi:predicted RNA-binding Zn ribbon-like protein
MPNLPGNDQPPRPKHESRPPAFRIGDHLALDFLNTVAAPRGTTIEWLGSGADLLTWMRVGGLIGAADATETARWPTSSIDEVAREAIQFREWLRKVVTRLKIEGIASLKRSELSRINGLMAVDAGFSQISKSSADAGNCVIEHRRHWSEPRQLLVPVAVEVADLICNADWELIRKCENPPCTIWFNDRTKGHRRRWCTQAICGNRAKVAAFRERQRQSE